MLHSIPRLNPEDADTSLWRDVAPPCKPMHVTPGSYASIRGRPVTSPTNLPGVIDPTQQEEESYEEDDVPCGGQQPEQPEQQFSAYNQYGSPQSQYQDPLNPYTLHAQHDDATLKEMSAVQQEDRMERELRRSMAKVRRLKRKVKERMAEESQYDKDPLWSDEKTKLTPQDLEPQTPEERKAEREEWEETEEENQAAEQRGDTAAMLKAARLTEVQDRASKTFSRSQDRANQAEVGELTEPTSDLWWERDPKLHYRDLGPDGKPVPLRTSFNYVYKHSPRATHTAHRRDEPEPDQTRPDRTKLGRCIFCKYKDADSYLKSFKQRRAAGTKEDNPELPYTRKEWEYALSNADFVHTFPSTNDLRVLDWLGADDDGPYDARKDSMSATGAVVPVPKGYNDPDKFPMAKGFL